jgi:hypothetical protein
MNLRISPEEVDKVRNLPIAFTVGCGRSGTTLLQSLMNSHPNIIATPECAFILMFHAHFGKIKNWTQEDILQFVDKLYSWQNFALWLLDRKELTENLLAILDVADYALVCKMVYYQMRKDKENVLVMVDKNPVYSIFADKMLEIFPSATFIHIVREPKDTIYAHISRFHKKNTFFLAWYWKDFNRSIEQVKGKLPDRFFTILYEEFVKNAELTLKDLCRFLEVPFDARIMQSRFPDMLPLYKKNKTFERIKIVHEGLLSPINDSNIGKWRKDMKERDLAITEIISGDYALRTYKYPREEKITVIPYTEIWLSWLQYYSWKVFTKFRFANYKFNMYYRNRKVTAFNKKKSNEII